MVRLRDRYWTAVDYVNPYANGAEVAFLEWMDPLFAAGHWTPGLIEAAGGRHSLNPAGAKSRRIEPEDLVAAMPDRLIVCPCGYDLAAIRREIGSLTSQRWWRALPAVDEGNVMLVDGNQMFNRPGPRLVEAFRWLVAWLNDRPEVLPPGFPAEALSR
jgi:ABC-type Fe3+-hydroxamate transport system substrate-binding protein